MILERRASTVLYNFLRSTSRTGHWLLPANVCPIVPAVFAKAGRTIQFVDIEQTSLCLNQAETLARLSRGDLKYAGLLFVRTYGHQGDFEAFFRAIKRIDRELLIVDDRCAARPQFNHLGGVADLELYSSGYAKFVDLGWGGWGFLRPGLPYQRESLPFDPADHDALVGRLRRLLRSGGRFECPATNWLDATPPTMEASEFEALVGGLATIAAEHRMQLNSIYAAALEEWAGPKDCRDWRFSLFCQEPNALLQAIFDSNHFASAHYQCLVPTFGCGEAPIADSVGRRVVNLFNDFRYTPERARELAEIVRAHLRAPALRR
jgi:hypothetical protein